MRIGLQKLEHVEVELPGDHVYMVVPATKAVSQKVREIEARVNEIDEDDDDKVIAVYGELLDVRLKPTEKGQPRASTVIKRLWAANEISHHQVVQLIVDIGQSDRPI